jgi:acyl dehydratase
MAFGPTILKEAPMTGGNGNPGALLYLDDLAVGQTFTTGTYEMTAADIVAFARTYDRQPFHMDDAAAKHTLFGGLAASGWHTAAVSMRLLTDGTLPLAGGLISVGGEIAWPRPTRPGDVLHVAVAVLEVTPSRSRSDRGMITCRNETRNQRGEVAQSLVAKLVVPRRPDAARG